MTRLLRHLLSLSFIFSAVESWSADDLPRFTNNTTLAVACQSQTSMRSFDFAPGESHADLARELLERFKKTELRNYQPDVDVSPKRLLFSQADKKQYSLIAKRIEGLLYRDRKQRSFYTVLRGDEQINDFFAGIQAHHETLVNNFKPHRRLQNLEFWVHFLFCPAPISLLGAFIFPYSFSKVLYLPTQTRRRNFNFRKHLKTLRDSKSSWVYSAYSMKVSREMQNSKFSTDDQTAINELMWSDGESQFSRIMSMATWWPPVYILLKAAQGSNEEINQTFKTLWGDGENLKRGYFSIDQLRFWDDETQEPVLIAVTRYSEDKPKNPPSQTQHDFSCEPKALAANGAL